MSKTNAKSAELVSKKWTVYGYAKGRNRVDFNTLLIFTTMKKALMHLEAKRLETISDYQRYAKEKRHGSPAYWENYIVKIQTLEDYFTGHHASSNFYKIDLDNNTNPVKIERDEVRRIIKELKL